MTVIACIRDHEQGYHLASDQLISGPEPHLIDTKLRKLTSRYWYGFAGNEVLVEHVIDKARNFLGDDVLKFVQDFHDHHNRIKTLNLECSGVFVSNEKSFYVHFATGEFIRVNSHESPDPHLFVGSGAHVARAAFKAFIKNSDDIHTALHFALDVAHEHEPSKVEGFSYQRIE